MFAVHKVMLLHHLKNESTDMFVRDKRPSEQSCKICTCTAA